jgi:hypothetical protein
METRPMEVDEMDMKAKILAFRTAGARSAVALTLVSMSAGVPASVIGAQCAAFVAPLQMSRPSYDLFVDRTRLGQHSQGR